MSATRRSVEGPHGSVCVLPILSVLPFLAVGLICATVAQGADTRWKVPFGNWSTAANWDTGEPGAAVSAYVSNGGTAVIDQAGETCATLYLGGGPRSTISMIAGSLSANAVQIGFGGRGTFSQTGGVHALTAPVGLLVQGAVEGDATYNLGGGQLLAGSETIGDSGVGTFTQTSGINTLSGILYLAYSYSTAAGTYSLAGSGQLSAVDEHVGRAGTGTFIQTDGTNRLSGTLYLGTLSGAKGTYTLSGGQLTAPIEYVGSSGTGTFNQSGGVHTVSTTLVVGSSYPGTGTFNLSDAGQLIVKDEYIGSGGTGTFSQTGGTHTVSGNEYIGSAGGTGTFSQTGGTHTVNSKLYVGFGGGNGTYTLRGGTLMLVPLGGSVSELRVGADCTARFEWFGGSLTTPTLTLGPGGTLAAGFDFAMSSLLSGALFHGTKLNGLDMAVFEVTNGATVTHDGCSATVKTLKIGSATGPGTYRLTASGTLGSAGARASSIQIGTDAGSIGRFEWFGGNNLAALSLILGTPQGSQATLAIGFDFSMDALRSGMLYQGSSPSGLDKATLEVMGGATATHSSNPVTFGGMRIGSSAGAGTYSLNGGASISIAGATGEIRIGADSGEGRFEWFSPGLSTPTMTIGARGTLAMGFDFSVGNLAGGSGGSLFGGKLNGLSSCILEVTNEAQATQTSTVTLGTLRVGTTSGSGTYNQYGGTLTAPVESIGYSGPGTFTQQGGGHTVSTSLTLGENLGASGTYNLQGGSLLPKNTYVGKSGFGQFNQTGGTHTVSGGLYVGYAAGSAGIYSLGADWSYGNVNAPMEYIGYAGAGTFIHSGGDNHVTNKEGMDQPLYVGFAPSARGTYILSGTGSLYASDEYVGYMGTGAFTQSGGYNGLRGRLFLGYNYGAQGTYNLGGTAQLTPDGEVYVGYYGTGIFTQSGGEHSPRGWRDYPYGALYLGYALGAQGTYNLSGTAKLTPDGAVYVGYEGTGTFVQTGGELYHHWTPLYLGYSPGSQGTYNLSGGTLSADEEHVGEEGSGAFVQTGGVNDVGRLSLANERGASGTYDLSGTGQLKAQEEILGGSYEEGTAVFRQSGGTNTAWFVRVAPMAQYLLSGGLLQVDWVFEDHGATELSGTGQLAARDQHVDGLFRQSGGTNTALFVFVAPMAQYLLSGGLLQVDGQFQNPGATELSGTGQLAAREETVDGLFRQTGGTNTATYVSVPGRYELHGGTLQVSAGFNNEGTTDFGNGPAVLRATDAIVNLARPGSSLLGTGGASLEIGPNSLLIVPAGVDPATAFAHYSNAGMVHTAGTTLVVPAGQGFSGWGWIDDHVECEGAITAGTGGFINLNSGLLLSGAGRVDLGWGGLTVDDAASGQSGGSLAAFNEYIGNADTGVFTHSAGTNTVGTLFVGNWADVSGTYNLSGTAQLSAADAFIGNCGKGAFTQAGGAFTLTGGIYGLYLGYASGSSGTYNLEGGTLSVPRVVVGSDGTGMFNWTGGTLAAGTLRIGAGGKLSVGCTVRHDGALDVLGGTVEVAEGHAFTVAGALGEIADNKTLRKTGEGTLIIGGPQSHRPGATLAVTAGRVDMNTDAGSAALANLAVTVSGSAAANFGATQHLAALGLASGGRRPWDWGCLRRHSR